MESTDLLRLNARQTYDEVRMVWEILHRVRRYSVLQGTERDGMVGEVGGQGLLLAMTEF